METKQSEADGKKYRSPVVGLARSSSWRSNSSSGEEWREGLNSNIN